jgi:glycosyltransferase involved in cell wall biosynthesis
VRIAQIAPLYESVPPQSYGGTERVVSYLTEELVRQGHDVTLFASGDSVTRAQLVAACPRSLRTDPNCLDSFAHHVVMIEEVFRRAAQFDLLHFHIDYFHFPLSRRYRISHVTTLHGRLDLADLVPLYREFPEMPVVSISDAQRKPLPWLSWAGTVHHGLPEDLLTFRSEPGEYLAFLGRISPEKGLDRAIEISRLAGLPLRVAAKVDRADRDYYEKVIRPLLRQPHVEFLGEIGGPDKDRFLGEARALLFPVEWPEPFGLVMIEALACGTPVIAFPRGSVPEIMADRRTGFVCGSDEEAVEAVAQLPGLPREECRQVFEERFTARRMAEDYLRIYERILTGEVPDGQDGGDPGILSHRRHRVTAR